MTPDVSELEILTIQALLSTLDISHHRHRQRLLFRHENIPDLLPTCRCLLSMRLVDQVDHGKITRHRENCGRCSVRRYVHELNADQGLHASRRVLMISGSLTPCNKRGLLPLLEWITRVPMLRYRAIGPCERIISAMSSSVMV